MPRIRTVKPEFFEDEDIGMLSREARLLFIGSWGLADDEGLLRWAVPFLKASVFMYDDDLTLKKVEAAMEELVDAQMVFEYRGGKSQQRLGWIVNFRRHQVINKPQPGKLPPPSIQNPKVIEAYCRRDQWRCGICGEDIEQDSTQRSGVLKFQPSIDHIKPRSKGGNDYPTNLRAVHQGCNASRGNRSQDDSGSDSGSDSGNVSPNGSAAGSGSERKGKEEEGKGRENSFVEQPLDAPADFLEVFDYWRNVTGRMGAKPTSDRRTMFKQRKAEGFSVEEMKRAIDGSQTPDAVDHKTGHRYDDFKNIFRNGTNLDVNVGRASAAMKSTRDFVAEINGGRR